jgi:hypothetical protein
MYVLHILFYFICLAELSVFLHNTVLYNNIERPDQGHLYPLGERRDKHVRAGREPPALQADALPNSEPLHGCPSACGVTHGLTWRRLVAHM